MTFFESPLTQGWQFELVPLQPTPQLLLATDGGHGWGGGGVLFVFKGTYNPALVSAKKSQGISERFSRGHFYQKKLPVVHT